MYFTQTSHAYLINAERMNPPREKSTTTSSYLPEPLGWEVDGKKSARTGRRFSARTVRRDGGRSERKEDGSVVRGVHTLRVIWCPHLACACTCAMISVPLSINTPRRRKTSQKRQRIQLVRDNSPTVLQRFKDGERKLINA